MTPPELIEILKNLDIDSLNSHLSDGSLKMKDLEGKKIKRLERVENCDTLFLLYNKKGKCVNTVNDSYLYNCGFALP